MYILCVYFFLSSLCHELHSTADFLDLLLGKLGNKLGLDNHGLRGKLALAQHLEVAVLGDVNDRGRGGILGGSHTSIFTDQSPELVEVDDGAEVLVLAQVEVSHTDLQMEKNKIER